VGIRGPPPRLVGPDHGGGGGGPGCADRSGQRRVFPPSQQGRSIARAPASCRERIGTTVDLSQKAGAGPSRSFRSVGRRLQRPRRRVSVGRVKGDVHGPWADFEKRRPRGPPPVPVRGLVKPPRPFRLSQSDIPDGVGPSPAFPVLGRPTGPFGPSDPRQPGRATAGACSCTRSVELFSHERKPRRGENFRGWVRAQPSPVARCSVPQTDGFRRRTHGSAGSLPCPALQPAGTAFFP